MSTAYDYKTEHKFDTAVGQTQRETVI